MAHRREINFSEESYTSSLVEKAQVCTNLLSMMDEHREGSAPRPSTSSVPSSAIRVLQQSFPCDSFISTTSSFAVRQQAAQCQYEPKFKKIGAGQCGILLDVPGRLKALKVTKGTMHETKDLMNDFVKHVKVQNAFARFPTEKVLVPKVFDHINPHVNKVWREENAHRFPEGVEINNLIVSERILPLTRPTREALIDRFCPENLKHVATQDPANSDCLVRIYLGRRQDQNRGPRRFFSLRNFCLYLNQMEDLSIPTFHIAESLAEGLAIMHWSAKIDAMDVEFVFGSSPGLMTADRWAGLTDEQAEKLKTDDDTTSITTPLREYRKRAIHIWLLDFNQCQNMLMDVAGIKQAVDAFFVNDPYYPRPSYDTNNIHHDNDQHLWMTFRRKYLEIAHTILKDDASDVLKSLPAGFVNMVEERQQKKLKMTAS